MSSNLIKNSQTILSNPFVQTKHEQAHSIEPQSFGKVAVLMGGTSGEREVSLESGQAVLAALKRKGVDAHGIDTKSDFINELIQGQFQLAFNMVHGTKGEDGTLQGLLEYLNIPYVGSDAAASALAMDKAHAKLVWMSLNVPTAPFGLAYSLEEAEKIATELNTFPLSVKPNQEGSSLGVTKIMSMSALPEAFALARQYGPVIVEKWIEGTDFFVSIVGDDVYPAVQVKTSDGFYDYCAKYQSEKTEYICPAPLTSEQASELAKIAQQAHFSLGCRGWGRVDFIKDAADQFWVLETNTIPGMTSHSLVPQSARAAGISFDDLVFNILSTALIDEKREQKQVYAATQV